MFSRRGKQGELFAWFIDCVQASLIHECPSFFISSGLY
ncbi:hypothetical protein D779_2534 [Imhoffiella purpurea]|uniref:Uncharacterized protein n=1 Tax=Imhoffiella purpurea TaxID=1249627 RepID=W9VBG8_9GAMM|nr:hypothetical protein D779_2534 [Imhoffiella purpurea]